MSDHSLITRAALEALPQSDRAIWSPYFEPLIADYCHYPDRYFDPEVCAAIEPYILLVDGRPFHYTPPNRIVTDNWVMTQEGERYRLTRLPDPPNVNWVFVSQGLTYYLARIPREIRAGHMDDAAKLLGVLLHFFQDAGHLIHALEGPDGTDIKILDRLIPVPEDERYMSPTMILCGLKNCEADIRGYRPKLWGTSMEEAAFRLYSAYVAHALRSRIKHVPILQARLSDEVEKLHLLLREMDEDNARMCADVVHTVTALGRGDFDPQEAKELDVCHLDEIAPIHQPANVSLPYRFTPIVKGGCLDGNRRRHPLRLRMADGNLREFERGWGSGCHVEMEIAYELPVGVYERLLATIGLHEPLGREGRVRLAIELAGAKLLERILTADESAEIDLPVFGGGLLRFILHDAGDGPWHRSASKNNLVWGDPKLIKRRA